MSARIARLQWDGEVVFYNPKTRRYSLSKEAKKRISDSIKGVKHPNWKGGITPKNKIIRGSNEAKLWREAVFKRDNWICQKTKEKGNKLHAHHIKNFAQFPELRFTLDNGITLSKKSAYRISQKIWTKK